MTEDALLKYAQPFLIGLGLILILNFWNIVQMFLDKRARKDSTYEKNYKEILVLVITQGVEIKGLQKDINNIGAILRKQK